jgi:transcriptional regulator with XRE-family HTH domain
MKWADYKKGITALDSSELKRIEIVAQLIQRGLDLKLTQSDLAKKSGLKQAAIARLESEKATPRLDTLERVAKALDLKLTLFEESNHNTEEVESV